MKATISPLPVLPPRIVTLELTEKEARILKDTFAMKTGVELEQFFHNNGIEKMAYELYNELSKIV